MKVKKHLISNEAHGGIFKSWDRPMREWILKDLEEKVHSFHNSVTHGEMACDIPIMHYITLYYTLFAKDMGYLEHTRGKIICGNQQ